MLNKRGFTLIELLIVISIIAILSVIGIIVYTSVTVKARDARRKLDLQNIAQALEVYYQKNGQYPITKAGWVASNNYRWSDGLKDTVTWKGLVSDYISTMPIDPKSNDGNPAAGDYLGYAYWAYDPTPWPGCPVAGQYYALVALLENQKDSDRNEVKNYKWCNGASTLDMNWSRYSYAITSK